MERSTIDWPVWQTECNNTEEGFERFACPTPDNLGRYRCIEDRLFCDGYYDCPGGEDEERVSCMYYKLVSNLGRTSGACVTQQARSSPDERETNRRI